jgi:hypothetical protein
VSANISRVLLAAKAKADLRFVDGGGLNSLIAGACLLHGLYDYLLQCILSFSSHSLCERRTLREDARHPLSTCDQYLTHLTQSALLLQPRQASYRW